MADTPHRLSLLPGGGDRSTSPARVTCGGSARPIALALLSLPLAACMVGPDYARPHVEVADRWLDMRTPPTNEVEDARWWTNFGDPVLESLVEQALGQNLTLRQAGLRVIQARAALGIAVGEFFPQEQAITGRISDIRTSENSGGGDVHNEYRLGFSLAWELDFWGRFRRGIESADAALEASVADYDAALVLLASDVASNYVTIRSLQEQLFFTATNARAQREALEITRIRFEAGAVSELDVATAQGTLSNTEAILPGLEIELREAQLALCVLLGRTPSQLEAELGPSMPVPTAPAEIAVGIPADLLRRRPDVRAAERRAASLSAQIGVATADAYPSLSILGATGFEVSNDADDSPDIHDLLDADSFAGFIGLDLFWPVLNYGRISNAIRFADAAFQEAAVAYQETVLQAAADVEAGLVNFLRSREEAAYLEQSVAAARRTVELSLIQYRQGAEDFLRVNQAQVDLTERQNNLIVARANVALGAIATYRALGGGWETRIGHEFVPQSTVDEMRARTDWGNVLLTNDAHDPQPLDLEHLADAGESTSAPAAPPKETQHGDPE